MSVKSETKKKLRLISLPLQPQSTGKRALGLQTINVISKSCQPLQKYESTVRHLFVLAWTSCEENLWVPMRNQTLDCQIPSSAALPLSHRDSMVSEAHYEVQFSWLVWNLPVVFKSFSNELNAQKISYARPELGEIFSFDGNLALVVRRTNVIKLLTGSGCTTPQCH